MSNLLNVSNSQVRRSQRRRRSSINLGLSVLNKGKSFFGTNVAQDRILKQNKLKETNQTDMFESEETKESERTKMNKKFQLLYIPKSYLDKETLNTESAQKFTKFASLDGSINFLTEKNQTCPSNTIKGLKRRLKYNKSAKNLYLDHYNKQQKSAVSLAVDKLKEWKTRNNKMPKILVRPKHHSMIAGSLIEKSKGNRLDESSMVENRKLVFNSKMFNLPKKRRKKVFNVKKEDRESLVYKKKNYAKKIRLRNLLKKTGVKSGVIEKVENEKKQDNFQRKKHLRDYTFAWYKPQQLNPVLSREGATFDFLDGKGWLIGGIGERILDEIYTYNFKTHEFDLVDDIRQDIGVSRFNHTTVIYKGRFWVFGGELFNNLEFRSRRVLNDVKILDPVKKHWISINASGEYINPRRNHIAVAAGKLMIVNGGLTQNGEVLNDTWTFNFESKTWSPLFVYKYPPYLSHHTACAVFNNPEKVPEISHRKFANQEIKSHHYEGIYLFGGKGSDRKPSNRLLFLNMFTKPPSYTEPSIVGSPPAPRYGHCMEYYPVKKLLIIYGGRNDDMFQFTGKCNFDDVHVLNLKYMGWCKVKTGTLTPRGRYYFSSFLIDTKMFIFGGLHECNYVSGITECLELDEMLSYKIIDQQSGDKILDEISHPKIEINKGFLDDEDDIMSMIEQKQSPNFNEKNMPKGYFNKEIEEMMETMTPLTKPSFGKKASMALLNVLKSTANLTVDEEEEKLENFVSYQPLPNAFSLGNVITNKERKKEIAVKEDETGNLKV